MSKRPMPQNVSMSGDVAAPLKDGLTPAAVGHAGHVIRIHADYGVYCETDSAFLNADALSSGKKPGV